MPTAPSSPSIRGDSQLRRDLRAMLGDGVAASVMVGIGESYLPAFALALGHGDVVSGLVATVPMLAGALLQLASPAAVGILDSHRRWIVLCAGLQALCFAPLVVAALAREMDLGLLYAIASLYWGLGMSTGPAWTAWASSLVPARMRPAFFANRARASQLALVLALVAGGLALQLGKGRGVELTAYAVIFGIALVARAVSVAFLRSQREPASLEVGETSISPSVISRHVRTGGHGRLLLFLLTFQSGVMVASPYFTPYMLSELELSYLEFTVLTATAFGARVLALPFLGRFVRRAGTRAVLLRAGLTISTFPILWLVTDHFAWLVFLQILSGVGWAAFELASLLSFFERIPPHGQTSVLTLYNLANATAVVTGSAVGGLLLRGFGEGRAGFVAIFVVSTLARIAMLGFLRRVPELANPGEPPPMQVLSVRPGSGGEQRPVLTDDAPRRDGKPEEDR
ncbi:MAG: MFS transporter [Myxococcota bacterium]